MEERCLLVTNGDHGRGASLGEDCGFHVDDGAASGVGRRLGEMHADIGRALTYKQNLETSAL